MSIIIPGVLTIKSIQGARGAFSVGDLRTEVGEFRIKDTLLDEYEPGQYTGRFVINSIFPFSYSWRGRVSIEIRANLQEIFLDEAEVAAVPSVETVSGLEPDPLDEEPGRKAKQIDVPTTAPVALAPIEAEQAIDADLPADASQTLFDREFQAMIDAGETVKLDPTIDRTLFRQQRDALKAMGYTFNPSTQSWSK